MSASSKTALTATKLEQLVQPDSAVSEHGSGSAMLSKPFLSPRELAAELDLGYRTILDAIHAGRLTGYRIGGNGNGRGARIRLARSDIQEWLKKHCSILAEEPTDSANGARPSLDDYRL